MIKHLQLLLLFVGTGLQLGYSQNQVTDLNETLSFEEYLGYVKQHHPLIKQANLQLSIGEATLLKARGGFDPKFEVDYDRKKFKQTEYYDQLNAVFKIPTWYGIEFKANFEENSGQFLDPSLTVPEDGLYSAGVSISALQGLLINDRMAMLKKAKFFVEQTRAEQILLANNLFYEASLAYLDWLETYNELNIYKNFVVNAEIRFKGVKRNVEVGEKAAIDSIEAKIAFQNRKLSLEAAQLKTRKAALKASNYLWLNEVPLEIQNKVNPSLPTFETLSSSLFLEGITNNNEALENHPKLRSLDAKINGLKVDRSLKRNKLLPRLDLQYNFLTQEPEFNTLNTVNYKAFVNFSFPLFLRKERGDLKLANIKLQDAQFEKTAAVLTIQNKIDATIAEINSLETQNELIKNIVIDYQKMLTAEERKFELGESSLFLINSREQKLIEAALKANSLNIKYLNSNANLFNALGTSVSN